MITVPIWSAQVFFVLVMTLTWHLLVFKDKRTTLVILLGNSVAIYFLPILWREDPAMITMTPVLLFCVSTALGGVKVILGRETEAKLVASLPPRKGGKA